MLHTDIIWITWDILFIDKDIFARSGHTVPSRGRVRTARLRSVVAALVPIMTAKV
jgi:hypothetical protein